MLVIAVSTSWDLSPRWYLSGGVPALNGLNERALAGDKGRSQGQAVQEIGLAEVFMGKKTTSDLGGACIGKKERKKEKKKTTLDILLCLEALHRFQEGTLSLTSLRA